MVQIFNFIGNLFGYILWAAFYIFQNFGIAIIIFTLIVKLILLPFSVKQQKSMASNARFQKKQREIMERYKNDRAKAQEEVNKLMAKENISPTAGCLPMMAPMFVMLGVYYSVINPLTNTLHIASDKVTTALNSLSGIPGIGSSINAYYGQIYVVKYFDALKAFLTDGNGKSLFSSQETQSIAEFGKGFNFLGWDLLATPSGSSFGSMLWLIPVLCFVTSVLSMFLMQKMNGTKMQGCMVAMVFTMPLFSAWIAYSVPAAVGFYWIISTIFGFAQSCVLNLFYNASIIEAKMEAQRVVLRRQQEAEVAFIDVPDYVAPSQMNKDKSDVPQEYKQKKKKKPGKK